MGISLTDKKQSVLEELQVWGIGPMRRKELKWEAAQCSAPQYEPSAITERLGRKIQKEWAAMTTYQFIEALKMDSTDWFDYHAVYRQWRESWEKVPAEVLADFASMRPFGPGEDATIYDLGCGECLFNKAFARANQTIEMFDAVAIYNEVTQCNIANVPRPDNSADLVILCLVLINSDWREILKEAKRLMRPDGQIWVSDVKSKYFDVSKYYTNELGLRMESGPVTFMNGSKHWWLRFFS